MYGGLCAGASALNASIALEHAFVDTNAAGDPFGDDGLEADRGQLRLVLDARRPL